VSKAIREAEKRARERELQKQKKPYEELRMAAKVKPTPIKKGSSNPEVKTEIDEAVARIKDAISFEMLRLDKYPALVMLNKVIAESEKLRERLVKT